MSVLPFGFFGSTTFNPSVTSFELLAQRIRNMLGEPLVQVEISDIQLYQCINEACEYYTKFTGNTEEFLVFRSDKYIPGIGLPIGQLMNITPDQSALDVTTTSIVSSVSTSIIEYPTAGVTFLPSLTGSFYALTPTSSSVSSIDAFSSGDSVGITLSQPVSSGFYTFQTVLSSDPFAVYFPTITNGKTFITEATGIDVAPTTISPANEVFALFPDISSDWYSISPATSSYLVTNTLTLTAEQVTTTKKSLSGGWDFDRNIYRPVVSVYSFSEGNNSGVNTLFSIEHTIAQQAYFGHLLGNVGYDLVTWNALKGWLDLREKVLAMVPYLRFYPETQMLKIIPEPNANSTPYYGLVACKMQKAIKDIVSTNWVYKYSMARAKQVVGHVRGKYPGSNLFGGQTVNAGDMMTQGLKEQDQLEADLRSGASGDLPPAKFFVG